MTEIKRRCLVAALVVALIAAGFYAIADAVSYLPCPVLKDPESVDVTSIFVIVYNDGLPEQLEDFDRQEVLEFLTTLQKQRADRSVSQVWTPTVCISFYDGNEPDSVFLCEYARDCVCGSYMDRYMILDSDRAFTEICEILNIDA